MKQPNPNSLQESRRKAGKLFRQGKLADAIEAQRAVVAAQLGAKVFPVEDYRTLAYFLQSNRDHDGAVDLLRAAERKQPGDFRVLRDLGRNLVLLNRPREALAHLEAARDLKHHDAQIHDLLAHAYGLAGDLDHAAKSGDIALLLKAKNTAHRRFKPLPAKSPPAFNADVPWRNIIAFNLWGADTASIRSALFNARNARGLYPAWRCRFYVAADTSKVAVNKLLGVGAQVVEVTGKGRLRNNSLWKLHVLEDESVDYFLLRDIRATVNVRERAAVDDWLQSGKWFHIMRDHYTHTDLIMPGMWGGARGALPGVKALLKEIDADAAQTGSLLRALLSQSIWPRIRHSVCIHDNLHRSLHTKAFPEESGLQDREYVGKVTSAPKNLERRARKRDNDTHDQSVANVVESEGDRLELTFSERDDEGLP